ncbi:LapA family protein [Mycobacterium sp. TY815]|uniref:LapA family protein n=1 Tax=Mycobacterium sp. TY815 TaxID=3050581 RepID=UPI0027424B9C|nr:LapA family protein [Mycobacterium sp. TY815]MDP7702005.1 LapA family protein [Mycobacterium sp. TY815]
MAEIAHLPRSARDLGEFEDAAERTPVLVVIAGAVLAFVVSVAAFALGQAGVGVAVASGGLLIFGAGLCWLSMERRRVRDAEREVLLHHPRS